MLSSVPSELYIATSDKLKSPPTTIVLPLLNDLTAVKSSNVPLNSVKSVTVRPPAPNVLSSEASVGLNRPIAKFLNSLYVKPPTTHRPDESISRAVA